VTTFEFMLDAYRIVTAILQLSRVNVTQIGVVWHFNEGGLSVDLTVEARSGCF